MLQTFLMSEGLPWNVSDSMSLRNGDPDAEAPNDPLRDTVPHPLDQGESWEANIYGLSPAVRVAPTFKLPVCRTPVSVTVAFVAPNADGLSTAAISVVIPEGQGR